jgi:hypothetical protein
MRLLILAGLALLGFGVYVLVHGVSYPSERSVLKVGEFEATYEEQRNVPAWAGALLGTAGVALIGVAVLRRRNDA